MATIGPDFIFNYSLQFSMAVAMSSLLGWQFGDFAVLVTNHLSRLKDRPPTGGSFFRVLVQFLSLEYLGPAKKLTLRYGIGLLAFCYIFSGFQILLYALFMVELIFLWIVASIYVEHRDEEIEPLPLGDYLEGLVEAAMKTDWRGIRLVGFIPAAIFLSLFFSHELGEARAKRVLESEPIYLEKLGLDAIVFAAGSVGTVLAIRDPEHDEEQEYQFILVGSSGEEIMRSR
ncbi:hypothetical protein [Pararhodobacter aggregans]